MYNVLVSIALQSVILKYVLENERNNCECALSWHHRFIKYFAPIVIVMLFVNLLFGKNIASLRSRRDEPAVKAVLLLLSVFALVSLVYSIVLIVYFFKLQLQDCKCSEDWKRYALVLPLILLAIILLVVVFVSLMLRLR